MRDGTAPGASRLRPPNLCLGGFLVMYERPTTGLTATRRWFHRTPPRSLMRHCHDEETSHRLQALPRALRALVLALGGSDRTGAGGTETLSADDITTKEQVFNAEKLVGTHTDEIVKKLVPGGHIGLFMGSHTVTDAWPEIGRWIREHDSPDTVQGD